MQSYYHKKALKEWADVPSHITTRSYCFTCRKGISSAWYHEHKQGCKGHKTTHTLRSTAIEAGRPNGWTKIVKPSRMVVIGATNGNGMTSSLNRHIGYFAGIVEAYAKKHNLSGSTLATGVSQFISEKGESS